MNSSARATAMAKKAHQLTIVDPGERIVSDFRSPLHSQPYHSEFKEVGREISRLYDLVHGIPDKFFDGDLRKYGAACGFTPAALDLLLMFREPIRHEVFARGDLIKNSDGWKLLELNAGSTVGGIFYASLRRLAGSDQSYDVLQTWAELTSDRWEVDARVAFVEDSINLEYMKLSLPVMADEFARASGQEVAICSQRDFTWNGRDLVDPSGKQIKFICNLFNELDVVKDPSSYRPIFEALQAGAVQMVMGPIYRLMANKGVLALLWSFVEEGRLSDEHSSLVKKLIPPTKFVSAHAIGPLTEGKDDWVLKPIDGFAGKGIFCGRDLSPEEWKSALSRISSQLPLNSYVAQRYAAPGIGNAELADINGEILIQSSRLLWGTFVFGQEYLGTFIRAKPDHGSSIINHANGASVGPIPE